MSCFKCFKKKIDNSVLKCQYEDTLPFIPPIAEGKVIKVYDGDTITIASKLPYKTSPVYRFSVRIAGIDCPEIKTKNETEKECALIAKAFVSDKILNKIVQLKNVKTEKYGRILADVYFNNNVSIGEELLKSRLAVKYEGNTKICPTDWMKYYTAE